MNDILASIRKELEANVDMEYKEGTVRYFKDKINPIGVRAPISRKIEKKHFDKIKHLDKKEIFSLCEQLLKTPYNEESQIGFCWAYRIKKQFTKDDFKTFERWLERYVVNWDTCDNFCAHSLAYLISKYPELISKTKIWRRSKNKWVRRGSAVIFIGPDWRRNKMDKKEFLRHVFEVADALMMDKEDLVQKGYGWMLKVAADQYQKDVFNYVMKNKDMMSRTALRYAIEKMPQSMRKKSMS